MIPNQWYPVLESRKLRSKPVAVRRFGERLVLWRDASGRAVCMRDRCPHRGVALSRGRVREGRLECPYHGFQYDGQGACVRMPCEGEGARIPAGMQVPTLVADEARGAVWVFRGDTQATRPEIPWFDELDVGCRGVASGSFDWPMNYVRSIETNFDIHHTPFVHGSAIPGLGKRVDPYHVEVEGTHIRTWGELRHEDRESGISFRIEFKPPSVTLLEFGSLLFAVADCPIDERNTWRYAVYLQSTVRAPGLHRIGSWLALQLDLRLIQNRQDVKMIETMDPQLPYTEGQGDRLVRSDAGIAAYLKLRRKLIADAKASDAALRQVS